MAISIVADSSSAPAIPGVTKTTRGVCDVYRGTAEALATAGLITLDQLTPQPGRRAGYTVFLPDGSVCSAAQRAWREPGYKTISQTDDGTLIVQVTVPKDVQAWRRKAQKAAEHEAEQERINEDVAKNGEKYRNWQFKQNFADSCESWEGTKAQLQAAGLGVGLAFPGEPGAPQKLRCKCPLGFEFVICLPYYASAKREARIYMAYSWYDRRREPSKEFEAYAPGVMREVWTPDGYATQHDTFEGAGDALVAAGLVPELRYFPGRPGANKMQASYLSDGRPASTSNGWNLVTTTIRKLGNSSRFSVQVPVAAEEFKRRQALSEARAEERKANEARLSAERKLLRQGAKPEKSLDEFRAERAESVKFWSDVLWHEFFKPDGALSLHIREDSELWDDLAVAFQTIRAAVQEADIIRDKKQVAAARTRLRLVAARNDDGVQSLLRDAKRLRLVRPALDDEQG